MSLKEDDQICYHHLNIYTLHYTDNLVVNRSCFDPFNTHKKLILNKKDLTVVSEQLKQNLSDIHIRSHTGLKICKNCVRNLKKAEPMEETEEFIPTHNRETLENTIANLNKSVGSLSSPVKIDKVIKLPMTRRADFIEAKADKIKET